MKRSVTEFERFFPQMLSTTLDIAVSCVNNVSKLIQNLPDEFCQSITKRNHTCWNGKSIGRYIINSYYKSTIIGIIIITEHYSLIFTIQLLEACAVFKQTLSTEELRV